MANRDFAQKIIGVPLSKKSMRKSDDGLALFVNGFFTSDNRDELGDTITRGATERALPKYRQWGNIRYMHMPKPAGKVVRIGENDGLAWNEVEIKVIDPQSIFEVENELLTALSVGILIRWEDISFDEDGGWVINDYQLAEISLVDHPANYDAKLKELPVDQSLRLLVQNYGFGPVAETFRDMLERGMPTKVDPKIEEELMDREEFISLRLTELLDENPELSNEDALAKAEADATEKGILDVEEAPAEPVVDAEPVPADEPAAEPVPEPEPEELSMALALTGFTEVVRQLSEAVSQIRSFLETQAEASGAPVQSEGGEEVDKGAPQDGDEPSQKAPANRSSGVPATGDLGTDEQDAEEATGLRQALAKYFETK
jgi:hypothetical protein